MAATRLHLASGIQYTLWRLRRTHVDATAMLTDGRYAQEILDTCRSIGEPGLLDLVAQFEALSQPAAAGCRRVPGLQSRDLARYNHTPKADRIHQPPRCPHGPLPVVGRGLLDPGVPASRVAAVSSSLLADQGVPTVSRAPLLSPVRVDEDEVLPPVQATAATAVACAPDVPTITAAEPQRPEVREPRSHEREHHTGPHLDEVPQRWGWWPVPSASGGT